MRRTWRLEGTFIVERMPHMANAGVNTSICLASWLAPRPIGGLSVCVVSGAASQRPQCSIVSSVSFSLSGSFSRAKFATLSTGLLRYRFGESTKEEHIQRVSLCIKIAVNRS
jgi:hypothetical protein